MEKAMTRKRIPITIDVLLGLISIGLAMSVLGQADGAEQKAGGEGNAGMPPISSVTGQEKPAKRNTAKVRRSANSSQKKPIEAPIVTPLQPLRTKEQIWSVAFSPNGQTLACGSFDGTINLWAVGTGSIKAILDGHKERVQSVTFSPDGSILASSSDDRTIRLWRTSDNRLFKTFEERVENQANLVFSPDGKILAAAGFLEIKLLRIGDGTLLRALEGRGVAFSPNGQTLVVADGLDLKQWQMSDGRLLRTINAHPEPATKKYLNPETVTFSPDGQVLAAGSLEDVSLWRVNDGKLLRILKPHLEELYHSAAPALVYFSPDGKTLLSAYAGNLELSRTASSTIRLWQTSDGRELSSFTQPLVITSVAFSPDGKMIAAGGSDDIGGVILLWQVN
jgi:WD40 repeat protein